MHELSFQIQDDDTLEPEVEESCLSYNMTKSYNWRAFRTARSDNLKLFYFNKQTSVGIENDSRFLLKMLRKSREIHTPLSAANAKVGDNDQSLLDDSAGVSPLEPMNEDVPEVFAEVVEEIVAEEIVIENVKEEESLVKEEEEIQVDKSEVI